MYIIKELPQKSDPRYNSIYFVRTTTENHFSFLEGHFTEHCAL